MKKVTAAFNIAVILLTLLSVPSALHGNQLVKALDVEGIISNDITWTSANSPYILVNNLTVARGATLRIEPGVEVRFQAGLSLIVNGSLYAVGTSINTIVFTSNSEEQTIGEWNGIKLTGDENSSFTMKFTEVEFARDGISIKTSGKAVIENSKITECINGIHVEGAANLLLRDNHIQQNSNGIDASGTYLSGLKITGNQISKNENGIYLNAFGDTSRISNITISENIVEKNAYSGIYLSSSARWGNGSDAYINNVTIFGNAISSNPQGIYMHTQGWWGGYIYDSTISDNNMSFSEYALHIDSSSNWYSWISDLTISDNIVHSNENGIFMQAFRYPEPPFYPSIPFDVAFFENVISANNNSIRIFGDVRVNFTWNSIAHNSYGVRLNSSAPSESLGYNNDIYRNTAYGMYVSEEASIDAENNYWGAPSGPYHETLNPSGEGDQAIGNEANLALKPFSAEPFGFINDAPIAELKAEVTTVIVNQTVWFSGRDSFDYTLRIVEYFFDFGDGKTSSSSLGEVRHAYVSPGIYNASLVVMDEFGVRSTNTAVEPISVIIPSLNVSFFAAPLSVVSQGQVQINVRVSDGTAGVDKALVRLESDAPSARFEPSFGYTDSNGTFNSTFFAPSVSVPNIVEIIITVSKEGYEDASQGVYISVLAPPSKGIRFDSPWIWLFFAILTFIIVIAGIKLRKRKNIDVFCVWHVSIKPLEFWTTSVY